MGAKTSKSANITSTPKKEPVVAAEGENHVNGVGDAKAEVLKDGNNTTNHVIEVAKEEVKEIVKEIQEAATDIKENDAPKVEAPATPVVAETNGGSEKENKTPTPVKEGEEKPEKKKVTKRFSLRKLSFLRKEKKVKEDKTKNGEVTSPEKKETAEVVVVNGEGDAKTEEIKSDETKAEIKKEEETPAAAAPAVVAAEKVEETKPVESKIEETPKVEEKTETVDVSSAEKIENFTESVTKDVAEIEKKLESTIETVTTNGIKEANEVLTPIENGFDEKLSKEVSAE